MLPRWGPLAVALRSKGPRGRGRGGSLGGHGDPRPARRCSPGRAGLRPTAAPAGARSPASHPAPGQWPSGWDLRARRVRAVEVGGFRRPRRLPGLGAGAGNPGAASAPLTRASPPCVEASPSLLGETQTKVARPWRTRGHQREASRPPWRHRRRGSSVSTARRCRGFLFLSLCEERAAAIVVNPNPQSLRRRWLPVLAFS